MLRALDLAHGSVVLPSFMPDATQAVVRSVDSADLERCGVEAVVMNAYHLLSRPGLGVATALGGAHAMAGWSGPIITDSGGFQAYSILAEQPKLGRVTDAGFTVRRPGGSRLALSPERCVQVQWRLGADVIMCLDQCTHADDPPELQETAVARTIAWARRCRRTFDDLLAQRSADDRPRPLLFAVVQGGADLALRRRCCEALLEIGFDGYGYGGWPLDGEGNLLLDALALVRELVPATLPLHALGVGHPLSLVDAAALGYGLFDCALPTRDARRGRVYQQVSPPVAGQRDWLRMLFLTDERYIRDTAPIQDDCDCPTCTRYPRGYLHHLYRADEPTFQRLCTLHNLRFLTRLTAALR